jgi:hypothetical protein
MRSAASAVTRLRYLSPFERFLWLFDLTHPMHFSLAAEIEGEVPIETMRKALRSLQQRHPLLRASIERDDNGMLYFREARDTQIPLRVLSENGRWQLERALVDELATPFGEAPASLLRATLLQEDAACSLILTVHHAIADGLAVTYLLRDLMQALDGAVLPPLAIPPSQEGALGIVDDGDGRSNYLTAVGALPADRRSSDTGSGALPLPAVTLRKLSRALTTWLLERSRAENTTATGALVSALASALGGCSRPHGVRPKATISVGVSKRSQLHVGEQCGFFAGGVPLDVELGDGAGFWARARDVKSALAREQSGEDLVSSRAALGEALAEVRSPRQAERFGLNIFASDFVVSNLGALPFETRYSNRSLRSVFGPALLLGMPGTNMLGVATIDNEIALTYSSYAPVPNVLEQIEKRLVRACG